MDCAEMRSDDAVGLFGKRCEKLTGAEPGLHMTEGNIPSRAGQRRGNHGRGIPLRQDHVGSLPTENFRNGPHEMGSQPIER